MPAVAPTWDGGDRNVTALFQTGYAATMPREISSRSGKSSTDLERVRRGGHLFSISASATSSSHGTKIRC